MADHWPTWDELRANDVASGRLDEAKVAEHRQRMREALDQMARDWEATGGYEAG